MAYIHAARIALPSRERCSFGSSVPSTHDAMFRVFNCVGVLGIPQMRRLRGQRSITSYTYSNNDCCLHRSNSGGTGEPEELLGMHQSRFALRSWCYFIVKEQKETFIFVNGYNYPIIAIITEYYPNTKTKVSSLFRI